MAWVSLVILLSLLEYSLLGALVSRACGQFGIKAPATTGHPEFERYFHVQQNTLESLVILIPAMLIFAWYVSAIGSAVLGLVFVVVRVFYAYAYVKRTATPALSGRDKRCSYNDPDAGWSGGDSIEVVLVIKDSVAVSLGIIASAIPLTESDARRSLRSWDRRSRAGPIR